MQEEMRQEEMMQEVMQEEMMQEEIMQEEMRQEEMMQEEMPQEGMTKKKTRYNMNKSTGVGHAPTQSTGTGAKCVSVPRRIHHAMDAG